MRQLFFIAFLFFSFCANAQLVINEMSNGPSGSKEWVELLVVGTPACTNQCVDLRGWIIDDNNGTFATGNGNGIADGHMRFPNINTWACVPIGTIIVVYNNADRDPAIPADNATGANCTYILPGNSPLLEHTTANPTNGGILTYSGPYSANGDWATTQLNNTNDSYQTRAPSNTTVPYSAVSYGSNVNNTIIYFSGTGTGRDMYMANTVDNNPLLQANWVNGAAANETPGAPNNAANAAWINSMNHNCTVIMGTATVTASNDTTICGGGSARLTATSNQMGTFTWSNGTVSAAGIDTSSIVVSPTVTSTYTVVFTSATGCSDTDTVVVHIAPAITATVSVISNTTCNQANGSLQANASGGTAYTYQWNTTPAQSTQTASGLPAGSFTVTVTESTTGCTTTASQQVANSSGFTISATVVNAFCGLSNGSAFAVASGGTLPYTYAWSTTPVHTTDTINNLGVGSYTVTVTDGTGCTASAVATVININTVTDSVTFTNTTCGLANGQAFVTAHGGTGIYTYSWSTTPVQHSSQISNLASGTYTVTVTDDVGCTATGVATIASSTSVTASIIAHQDVACHGGFNGTATVGLTGATGQHTTVWNTTPVQTTDVASNLPPGTYTVVVTDSLGCKDSTTVNIINPPQLVVDSAHVNNTTCGRNNGSASLAASGGTGAYQYTWNTVPTQTTDTATNLANGTYSYTVADDNNCLATGAITVTSNSPALIASANTSGTKCSNTADGSAWVTVTAGTGPYTYSWNTQPVQNTDTAAQLTGGTYTVIVTDNDGCKDTLRATINSPLPVIFTATPTSAKCNGDSTGSIVLDNRVLTYSLNGGAFGSDTIFANLAPGTYAVTGKDVNGCQATDTGIVVVNPAALSGTITPDSTIITRGEQVTVSTNFVGGNSPYIYAWTPSTGLSCTDCASPIATPNDTTIYRLTITDANGCIDTANLYIGVRNQLLIVFPSAFTPDGNGHNDVFRAITNGPVAEYNLKIYNRWGELVFETNNLTSGWDGIYKGAKQNDETFVWYCQYKAIGATDTQNMRGSFTLLR